MQASDLNLNINYNYYKDFNKLLVEQRAEYSINENEEATLGELPVIILNPNIFYESKFNLVNVAIGTSA